MNNLSQISQNTTDETNISLIIDDVINSIKFCIARDAINEQIESNILLENIEQRKATHQSINLTFELYNNPNRKESTDLSKNWPIYHISCDSDNHNITSHQLITSVNADQSDSKIGEFNENVDITERVEMSDSEIEILSERSGVVNNNDSESDYIDHSAVSSPTIIDEPYPYKICKICKQLKQDIMLKCENCEKVFHISCVYIGEVNVNKIIKYYCDFCEADKSVLTEWRLERPSPAFKKFKDENYEHVEQIITDRVVYRKGIRIRQFRVKWKGYDNSNNSWVSENDMDGCLDTLQSYLRAVDKPLSKITGIVGARKRRGKYNKKNWIHLNDILLLFDKYKKELYPKVIIDHSIWTKFDSKDEIYFLKYENHCFTMLYIHHKKMAFISDGDNSYINDQDTSLALKKTLNIRLIPLVFKHQSKIDYCGSSSIVIALSFVRYYGKGLDPLDVNPNPRLYRRLIKRIHKYQSCPIMTNKEILTYTSWTKCSYCGKNYRTTDTKGLSNHLRIHQ